MCSENKAPLFCAEGINASYNGRQVLFDVSLSVEKGSLTGLLGANSSGKSTLLKAICSLVGSYKSCMVNGQNIRPLSNKRRSQLISYIPQRPSVSFSLSVTDIVMMGFNPYLPILSQPDKSMYQKAYEALKTVGLFERRDDDFLSLSEGQKQLCILARTIVQNTPVMLLDEPDSALDFSNRRLLIKTVKSITETLGKAAVLCSHDPILSLEFCDKIILLSNGRISDIIYPKTDSEETLSTALSKIYSNVTVFRYKDKLFMLKED